MDKFRALYALTPLARMQRDPGEAALAAGLRRELRGDRGRLAHYCAEKLEQKERGHSKFLG